jgi:hypothetical protein
MAEGLRGEEKNWFIEKIDELYHIITTMPKVYEQDGKGKKATVFLRYFGGGQCEWLITEKDTSAEQYQAFGNADLFGDGGELGYISIQEILENNGEIDLHFEPKTLEDCRK